MTDVTEGLGFAEGGKHSNVSVTLPISPLTLPSMCSLSSTAGDLILEKEDYNAGKSGFRSKLHEN